MNNRINTSANDIPAGAFSARKPAFGGWTRREQDKPREVEAEILPPNHERGLPARLPARAPEVDADRDEIPVGTFRSGGPPGNTL